MTQHKLDKAKEKTNRRTTTTNNNAQSASSKHEKKLTSENQKLLKQIAKLEKKIANFTSMEKQLAHHKKEFKRLDRKGRDRESGDIRAYWLAPLARHWPVSPNDQTIILNRTNTIVLRSHKVFRNIQCITHTGLRHDRW